MVHWACENRGYIVSAVYPSHFPVSTPAVETWKTDHPIHYILNDTGVVQVIDEVNSLSEEHLK